MAPAANIVSIGLSDEPGTDIMETLDYIEVHDLASIVSGSLGETVNCKASASTSPPATTAPTATRRAVPG